MKQIGLSLLACSLIFFVRTELDKEFLLPFGSITDTYFWKEIESDKKRVYFLKNSKAYIFADFYTNSRADILYVDAYLLFKENQVYHEPNGVFFMINFEKEANDHLNDAITVKFLNVKDGFEAYDSFTNSTHTYDPLSNYADNEANSTTLHTTNTPTTGTTTHRQLSTEATAPADTTHTTTSETTTTDTTHTTTGETTTTDTTHTTTTDTSTVTNDTTHTTSSTSNSTSHPDHDFNNVILLRANYISDIKGNFEGYSNAFLVKLEKLLTNQDQYDSIILNNWVTEKPKVNIQYGSLDGSHNLHEVSIRSRQDIIKMEAGSNYEQIIKQTAEPEWKKLSLSLNGEQLDFEYNSEAIWGRLPVISFEEAVNFNTLEDMQVYLLADGSKTPDVFMFSTFKGNDTVITSSTIIMDVFDEEDIIENGMLGGVMIGSRVMGGADIILFKYLESSKEKWIAEDSYCDLHSREVKSDSEFYLETQHEDPLAESATTAHEATTAHATESNSDLASLSDLTEENVMNVRLLTGENKSPAWFKLPSNTTQYGKFKNMWVFNWEKTIPSKIDPYDWIKLKNWNRNNGQVGGSWGFVSPEKIDGYHGVNRAGESNFKDGSGLRTNTTDMYGFFNITISASLVSALSYSTLITIFMLSS